MQNAKRDEAMAFASSPSAYSRHHTSLRSIHGSSPPKEGASKFGVGDVVAIVEHSSRQALRRR